ncbi:cytochrome P450 [Paenibacillus marchantiophytorum]|uniref:Cytochrome P450 n=1 Tax=Paenibacillus marchantiophytorum TaxID=1619310 RepID=A0ABQ1FEW3_9BACL|nr:cytochrome P450 [Paenibacillus marchantiophytorum]GGA07374.1 cytochrome P450 [Paenibacillus marchantiophytorum]
MSNQMATNQAVNQFSVYSDEYLRDMYNYYKELRDNEPIFWNEEMKSWFIVKYQDVSKYLIGETFITSHLISEKMDNLPQGEDAHFKDITDIISTWMIYNDRPVHTQLRNHMNRAFMTNEIELIKPVIKEIVTEIIEKVIDNKSGSFDFIQDIALPIPAMVLCRMLGIPSEEVDRFIKWSDDIALFMQNFVVSHTPDKEISEQTKGSMKEMYVFLSKAIADRRQEKKNDLLSRIIADTPGVNGELRDDQVIAQTIHLIFGGHKIPQFMLSNTLHLLFKYPHIFDQLKSDLSLLPKVLEECMRLEGPIQYITRHAAVDIEIRGVKIKKGDSVYFFLGSAGRYDSVFENPEEFKIIRSGNRHIGFGGGFHACIAAVFARAEIVEILQGVLKSFPNLQPVYDLDNPQWTKNPTFHGITTMPVVY